MVQVRSGAEIKPESAKISANLIDVVALKKSGCCFKRRRLSSAAKLLFITRIVDKSRLCSKYVYEPTRNNAVKLILPVSQDVYVRIGANFLRLLAQTAGTERPSTAVREKG